MSIPDSLSPFTVEFGRFSVTVITFLPLCFSIGGFRESSSPLFLFLRGCRFHLSDCRPRIRATNRSQNLWRDEVAARRAVPRRTRTSRDGGTEPAEYLLFRRNGWWRLENHRRR